MAIRAELLWAGDSFETLKSWPKETQRRIGESLGRLQDGLEPSLRSRPMKTVGAGVFELKDQDESKWYRVIYLARVQNRIVVLHSCTKNTAKTESNDLNLAQQRLKRYREETGNAR